MLCLLLSPVLAFLYHLFPFSFVRRSLSSSSVCLFVLVYFVVRAFDYTLCVLLRIRACTCAVSFMLSFVPCSLDSNFIFRFVVVHSSQVHLVWLYDHHLRRVLVASNRPPFVLIRSYIWIQAALLRIAAPAKLSHVILRALPRFRYFPHAIPGLFGRIIHPPALTFDFLDPFAIKLTLLAVRCLQFPFSCHPLAHRRQLSSF